MPKPIYVIGHRNPDTDSICSAIGYAYLKQSLGENAIAARAGKINAETKYVLEYFNVEIPVYIDDLYPRVKDVMSESSATINENGSVRELGNIMKKYNVKSVPVLKEDKSLVGMVSVGDLAKRYFDELGIQDLGLADVTFEAILKTIEASVVCGKDLERGIAGKVRIAAAKTDTLLKKLQKNDIIITGDRVQAHLIAIGRGVACLIVTGNGEVDSKVAREAEKNNVIILKTAYDTYTCARLINQSIPVRMIMERKIITFKPTELVSDIKDTIINSHFRNYPVVENGKFVGFISRDRLIVPERQKVILIDHNEYTQAVEGVEEAQILEIIDHHRLGGIQTSEPIFIRHEPVGCTATIVANMLWHRCIPVSRTIAGVLLSAIISDTMLFKSPTSTTNDKETAEKLAKIAEMDLNAYGIEMLKAGGTHTDMTSGEIVHNDLKEFNMGRYRVSVGQFSVMDADPLLKMKLDILKYMNELQSRERYDMSMLMVTDIISEKTHLFCTEASTEFVSRAFKKEVNDNILLLPNVMSRKKQVIPPLIEASKM
ncbi:MAG: putative manganese-dependent inorganic diphosphatase [bacterium]